MRRNKRHTVKQTNAKAHTMARKDRQQARQAKRQEAA